MHNFQIEPIRTECNLWFWYWDFDTVVQRESLYSRCNVYAINYIADKCLKTEENELTQFNITDVFQFLSLAIW